MSNRREPSIHDVLINSAKESCADTFIADVRLGLGYSAVCLNDGRLGICWSPKATGQTCTVFEDAGTLTGKASFEALSWLGDTGNPWRRVIGLATLNAAIQKNSSPSPKTGDIVSTLQLTSRDRLAMIGCFHPLLPAIRSTGCHLDIIELEASEPGSLSPREGRKALHTCTVAIVTATSLVTRTLDGILEDLAVAQPRSVVLLGPSTPLCPEAFVDTPVTHLAGSLIRDGSRALHIISEGGGTPQLKPCLIQVTLPVPTGKKGGRT